MATTVVIVSLLDMGTAGTSPTGSESEWSGSGMAMEGFHWNAIGPPEWECEAMGSMVWVQCATSVECF